MKDPFHDKCYLHKTKDTSEVSGVLTNCSKKSLHWLKAPVFLITYYLQRFLTWEVPTTGLDFPVLSVVQTNKCGPRHHARTLSLDGWRDGHSQTDGSKWEQFATNNPWGTGSSIPIGPRGQALCKQKEKGHLWELRPVLWRQLCHMY